jgi:hypothetical protein
MEPILIQAARGSEFRYKASRKIQFASPDLHEYDRGILRTNEVFSVSLYIAIGAAAAVVIYGVILFFSVNR